MGGLAKALVGFALADGVRLVDLDDPSQLASRRIRPSRVATMRRVVTQQIATSIFDEGVGGFLWWSTLDAEWINATLFHERALPHTSIVAPPRALSIDQAEVRQAAEQLGIAI